MMQDANAGLSSNKIKERQAVPIYMLMNNKLGHKTHKDNSIQHIGGIKAGSLLLGFHKVYENFF